MSETADLPAVHLAVHSDAPSWGGAEAQLQALLAGGAARGARRVSVLGREAAVVDRLVAACTVPATGTVLAAEVAPLDPRPLLAWSRALARLRPDLLHVNLGFTAGSVPVLGAALLTRTPYVLCEHLPLAASHPRLQTPFKRLTSQRARAHIAVSAAAARETEQFGGLPTGRVSVVANGVAAGLLPAERVSAAPTVVGVGRFTRQKGFDLLIDAVAGLPGVHLVLVGDGPEREALTRRAAATGMADRLHLPGWREDARAWLAGADIVAAPSRWEAAPLVLVEAMAEGRPVVSADVGGAREALDGGRCGTLVPPDDAVELRSALVCYLDEPALARAHGQAGRARWLQAYTEEAMLSGWRRVWAHALRGRPGR